MCWHSSVSLYLLDILVEHHNRLSLHVIDFIYHFTSYLNFSFNIQFLLTFCMAISNDSGRFKNLLALVKYVGRIAAHSPTFEYAQCIWASDCVKVPNKNSKISPPKSSIPRLVLSGCKDRQLLYFSIGLRIVLWIVHRL